MVAGRVNQRPKAGRGKVAVLCGLSLVLAALSFRLVKPKLSAGQAAPPPPLPMPAGPATPLPSSPTAAAKPLVIRWPDASARNPFHSAAVYPPQAKKVEPAQVTVVTPPPPPPPQPKVDYAAAARQAIQLKGTVQGERPVAMVNGRLYRVGESVANFRILEIGKRSITVEQAGVRVVIEAGAVPQP